MEKNSYKYIYLGFYLIMVCLLVFLKWHNNYFGNIVTALLSVFFFTQLIGDKALKKLLNLVLIVLNIAVLVMEFGFHYFTIG
jgi:hypothetical protein